MPLIDRSSAIIMVVGSLVSACTTNQPREHIAPSDETIELHTDVRPSGNEQWIYVFNRSSETIAVTNLYLSNCTNVKQRCGSIPLSITVRPGSRFNLMRVSAESPNLPMTFDYRFSWEAQ
jgi:hypothetical protein